jgi:hypothetical protein
VIGVGLSTFSMRHRMCSLDQLPETTTHLAAVCCIAVRWGKTRRLTAVYRQILAIKTLIQLYGGSLFSLINLEFLRKAGAGY